MQRKIQLTIPKPCHEQWSDFTPTQQGGYCHSCQKEVIDFTSWSEEQLKAYFGNVSSGTCGRFKQEQLKVYRYDQNKPLLQKWLSVTLTSLLLISSRQSFAQTQKPVTEQLQPDVRIGKSAYAQNDSSTVVRGTIMDQEGAFMSGVIVRRNGTSEQTVSDQFGNFAITLKNPRASDIIIFDVTGMETFEYPVLTDKPHQDIRVVLKENIALTNATAISGILGGAVTIQHSWYNPNSWRLTFWDWLK